MCRLINKFNQFQYGIRIYSAKHEARVLEMETTLIFVFLFNVVFKFKQINIAFSLLIVVSD